MVLIFKDGTFLGIDEHDHWTQDQGWLSIYHEADESNGPSSMWNMLELKGFFEETCEEPRITSAEKCLIQGFQNEEEEEDEESGT